MKAIHFRPATHSDLPTLFEFEQGVIAAERPFNPTFKPEKIYYYNLPLMIESPDTELVVAMNGEEIIGSGYARIQLGSSRVQYEKYAYLGFMYVRPDYRGKGIVKEIMEYLIDWAKSRGLSEVQLEVYDQNSPAVRAYEKSGFRKHLVRMRKKI